MAALTCTELPIEYFINHLFLPPKLPGEDDVTTTQQSDLLTFIGACIENFAEGITEKDDKAKWHRFFFMVEQMLSVRSGQDLSSELLCSAIMRMKHNDALPLYITMQNAGIIIRRASENFTLEWFQASPPPGDVTSTTGKLVMQFPVRPRLPFPAGESAIKSLCAFLVDLDCTKMHDAIPITTKAGCSQEETRDVADIRYISELLGGIARGMTEHPEEAAESTQFITKRINDHARYSYAEKPWRRDPIWLVVRVALQTTLQEYGLDGLYGYKSFVTFLLSMVLKKAMLPAVTTPQDHVLYVMNAKIAIRLQKAGEIVSSVFPFSEIAKVVRKCSSTLERNWSSIQNSTTSVLDLTPPSVEEIQSSCRFSLTNSKRYLSQVYNRQLELNTVSQHFDVDCFVDSLQLPSQRLKGISPPSRIPEGLSEADRWIAIQDIENWICQGLNNWRASLSTDLKSINSASGILRGLILTLHDISNSIKNPVLFSRLMLMNLELWVALDKLTVVKVPLLADYSPELDHADFEPLLLPTLEQMERFHQVEIYLKTRDQQANNGHPSIFRSDDSCDCFGYRFSRESTFATSLQNLRENIKREESREWMKKKQELKGLNAQYQEYLDYNRANDHDTVTAEDRYGYKSEVHANFCKLCHNQETMRKLQIQVFEEYLPRDDVMATLVVFELAMPAFIRTWRDITYILSIDNQTSQLSKASPQVILESYRPLSQFSSIPIWGVITLASTTKPFLHSHYKMVNLSIPCSEDNIYKHSALRYRLYDSERTAWMYGCPTVAIRERCSPTVSAGPYASLSWTIVGAAHTPNQVIARQNECPSELSWHEWSDFGELRAGVRVQWRNILLALKANSLTFSDAAVYLLIRQAAWQAEQGGSSVYRRAHREIFESSFGYEMLDILRQKYNAIGDNWKEGWTAATLTTLACRFYSLTADGDLKIKVLDLLKSLRQLLYEWMITVLERWYISRADASNSIVNQAVLRDRIIQLATACRGTFSLAQSTMSLLLSDTDAMAIFVHCGIVLQSVVPPRQHSLPSVLSCAVDDDLMLSIEALSILKAGEINVNGVDAAIRRCWQSFVRDKSPWTWVKDRWIMCRTCTEGEGRRACYVFLNMLDGTLLVDGRHIGNLPPTILAHGLFTAVFPNQHGFNIVPSTMRGMEYQLTRNIQGYEVHFQLQKEDLIIRLACEADTSKQFEFIHPIKLTGDVPNVLIHGTIIIFDDTRKSLDFHASPSGWDPTSSAAWSMSYNLPKLHGGNAPKLLSSSSTALALCPRSSVVMRFSQLLRSLEMSSCNLWLTWETTCGEKALPAYGNKKLIIRLPRYQIDFFLNKQGHIEWRQFSGMSISVQQSVGTLYGLTNKLVVDTKQEDPLTCRRAILIPRGRPILARHDANGGYTFVSVEISSGMDDYISTYTYEVDTILKRLNGDGTLDSWYSLIYFHIATSSHLPDPLLSCTGLYKAIDMLRSAFSFAFRTIDSPLEERLRAISTLAPVRTYYPKHLKVMESVKWNHMLSPLSQSDLLVDMIQDILQHGNLQRLFFSDQAKCSFEYGEKALKERALFRDARWSCSEYYQAVPDLEYDRIYIPDRCLLNESSRHSEWAIAEITRYVQRWRPRGKLPTDIWSILDAWSPFIIKEEIPDRPQQWLLSAASELWFPLFARCLKATKEEDRHELSFLLAILSYRDDIENTLINGLLAVACCDRLRSAFKEAQSELFHIPRGRRFYRIMELDFTRKELEGIVTPKLLTYKCSSYSRERDTDEERQSHIRMYKAACTKTVKQLARHLLAQWESGQEPTPPNLSVSMVASTGLEQLMETVTARFITKRANRRLNNYAKALDATYARVRLDNAAVTMPLANHSSAIAQPDRKYMPLALVSLFSRHSDDIGRADSDNDRNLQINMNREQIIGFSACNSVNASPMDDVGSVTSLFSMFEASSSGQKMHEVYGHDLQSCLKNLQETFSARSSGQLHNGHGSHIKSRTLGAISSQSSNLGKEPDFLQPVGLLEDLLYKAGLWPSSCPESLLRYLSFPIRNDLSEQLRTDLVQYAESLLQEQVCRRSRLLRHVRDENETQSWKSMEYIDWLLVQLDADILIRPVQVKIAHNMIQPSTPGRNAVMQLNMGEGKSSVIVPITSVVLANGQRLLRVIVPKPLSGQMFNLLKQRISRLANRRIFFLPFRRDLHMTTDGVRQISAALQHCMNVGGLLLCQPEHILSFKLMGYYKLCTNISEARPWIETQQWLDMFTRDILDESDELLSVKYQLTYTVGAQIPLSSDRWSLIQQVLTLVKQHNVTLAQKFPRGVVVGCSTATSFPSTRVLTKEYAIALTDKLSRSIIYEEKIDHVSLRTYTNEIRRQAYEFILTDSDSEIPSASYEILKTAFGESFEQLLLIRGLLGLGIVKFCLMDKRWSVDYGLHPERTHLAVPYRAKDSPALRAEFAHPDIIIILTCLSYYYGGLTNEQLESTFKSLMNCDNPEARYAEWTKGDDSGLPNDLNAINLDDPTQKHSKIFPSLRFNKAVIDFYLSESIFPKEAKQFEHKLTANAWDLAQDKEELVTGFSGTNDNRYLLPLSISQDDSVGQGHTNAEVLGYLLRPKNRTVVTTGKNPSAEDLIVRASRQRPPISVFLDVGAQILEWDNKTAAAEWLKREGRPEIEAAIYCDAGNDEFYVLTRNGYVEELASSLYRNQLEKTIVYLDEARTRGTDFKFPPQTRAVVTLGPKMTKDKLVQACMRLRRLGEQSSSSHSVLFFASEEIVTKIQGCLPLSGRRTMLPLDSKQVLLWTLHETCTQLQSNGPLWMNQGFNFEHRQNAWEEYLRATDQVDLFSDRIREPEFQSMEDLYGTVTSRTKQLEQVYSQISARGADILKQCEEYGFIATPNSKFVEEQERELAHEKESEKEVERLASAEPLEHKLDPNVRTFVQSGNFIIDNFRKLGDCLKGTSAASDLHSISDRFLRHSAILVTEDFCNTIKQLSGSGPGYMDSFLRPVKWILRSKSNPNQWLLISPFEANALLPAIRGSTFVTLHLYRPKRTRTSESLENLDCLVLPRCIATVKPGCDNLLILNLFAGQLYYRSEKAFKDTCNVLGLYLGEMPDEIAGMADGGGFVKDLNARKVLGLDGCLFHTSPVQFLRSLMVWRCKGQAYGLTHVGRMLYGRDLETEDFDDADAIEEA